VTYRVHVMTFLIALGLATLAPAQSFTTLYNFCSVSGCSDGGLPYAGVIQDSAGNLYGTTVAGGTLKAGTVFELVHPRQPNGRWAEHILYSFNSKRDGQYPAGGVIEDAKFKTYGCGSAIASSSLVTEWVKGKTLDQALTIKNTHIAEELALPPVKIHCSILAEDAIKAAVADYKQRHGASTTEAAPAEAKQHAA